MIRLRSARSARSFSIDARLAIGLVAAMGMVLASPAGVYAQPSVSGASGQWSHKGTVTISGSAFGTKATAPPVIWDDASGTNMAAKWDGVWPNNNPTYNLAYRTPQRGIALPHNRITRYIAGAHGTSAGADAGYNVMFFKHRTVTSFPAYTYVTWYQRADDAWVFGGDNNFKTFAVSGSPSPYTTPNWYLAYNPPSPSSTTSPTSYIFSYEETGPTLRFPDANGHMHWWGEAVNPMSGVWTKIEMEMKYTSASDGYVKLWENGVLRVNYVGHTDSLSGSLRSEGIGGYARMYGQPNNWRYFADVYLDYSRARVILGNAATYAASTVREVQIPTSWSSSSITLAVNLGRFADGQPAYVYVVDSDGRVNANGFRVTAAGTAPPAPGDTVAPTTTLTSPTGGSTVSNTVSLSASASDNVGVAAVQFKVDGANVGAEDATAPYSVSWNTTTVADGSHVVTAVARDAAGNSGTSSPVTVTVGNTSEPPPPPPPNTTAGLMAAYGFGEGSGTTVADASGRGNVGTISGAAWDTTGRYGSALRFDGVDDVVSIPDSATLDLTNGMTLEAWVRPTNGTNWRTVILKEINGGLAYGLYANINAPAPGGYAHITGTTVSDGIGGTSQVALNTWTHLAITYDGATLRIFVNGVQANSKPLTGSMIVSANPLRLGGNAVWGEYFAGMIDDVRIYNRALTASEIQADMATAVGSPTTAVPPRAPLNVRVVP